MAPNDAVFFRNGLQHDLEHAVRADDASSVDRLVAAGARVDARGRHGVTALMIAVDGQHPRAVAALLRAGADPNLKAADGAGAVHLAVARRRGPAGPQTLALVMRAGGDPDTRRPDGDPVLMGFVHDHDLDGLRRWRAMGASVDVLARSGRPLVSDVAYAQHWDAVWTLIELGARYDFEGTAYPLSKALASPYASTPDAALYPYKRRVWQALADHGIAVGAWVTLTSANGQRPLSGF